MKRFAFLVVLLTLLLSACGLFKRSANAPPDATREATAVPPTARPNSNTDIDARPTAVPGQIEPLADGGARLSTGDGLSLTLSPEGQITAITINGDDLPVTPAFPLVVRDLTLANAPDAPNQLANPDFESGDSGWSPYLRSNTDINVVGGTAYSGSRALEIRSQNENGQGAVISDPIAVTPGARYRVSGHFKVEFGYVDEAGNPTFWQDSLYSGERLVSGLYLQWLDAGGSPLNQAPQLAAALHWNAQAWHKISRELTAPPGAAAVQIVAGAKPITGAVWIDDLAWVESRETDQALTGALEIAGDHVTQSGETAGLQVTVTYRPYRDHIAIAVNLTDANGQARAFDAAWGAPLAADGWTWWDDLRDGRPITAGEAFANAVSADIMGYLPVSLYPYAALEDGTRGLALAQPLGSPRYLLLNYDSVAGRYEGRAHLGISPEAAKLNNSADFSLQLYQSDPAWGLRAAAEKHAAINPKAYDTPADFTAYSDFVREQFRADGTKGQQLQAYNAANVYASQYIVYELPVHMQEGDTPLPSFADARQYLESLPAESPKANYPASVICDSAGEPHLKSIGVYPWSGGKWEAIWIPNVDPDLPNGFGAQKLAELDALFADTAAAGLRLDGIFIDNFISTSAVDTCPAHLTAADLPLTYDPNTYQPGAHTASAGWEFLAALRALLDAQPEPYRSVSVNFWALNIPAQLAPYIDAFGGEGASAKGSNWMPDLLDYRMATAMSRPRLFANQQPDLTLAQVENFTHEALFYGVRPSRGDNGVNWPDGYEETLAWAQSETTRLIALGWQPITYAHSSHPDVWVERFGKQAFTTFNWGDAPADFVLTIDAAALGLETADLQITEAVSGEGVSFRINADGSLEISGRLEPGRAAVYWLE